MKKNRISVLTIDEAIKARYFTKEEGVEHHTWAKNASQPTDQKHLIYFDGELIKMVDYKPSHNQVASILKEGGIEA